MSSSLVARDELDDDPNNLNKFGTFRRSLRQINHFKSRLFRLPATPRLARAKKVLSRGEETTNWNFERPLYGNPMTSSAMANPETSLASSMLDADQMCMTVPSDSPAILRNLPPREDRIGGSCRVRNNRHSRPPLPSYNPPNAQEAEEVIQEHMKNLMTSPRSSHRQFLFLPDTSYAPSGEVYDASWRQRDSLSHIGIEPPSSPTHSTISCLQTGRTAMRSLSYGARDDPQVHHRPHYHLNGLFHQPSMKNLGDTKNALKDSTASPLLFSPYEFSPENGTENIFLGREWLFKELHQTVIAEQTTVTLIRGAYGAGKSAIMRQLVLHSPFCSQQSSNGDTVDSGIVVGSQGSPDSTMSSRNYEWLRNVANRVAAYHECHLYAANTCGIPEFVRNIATHLRASPLTRNYRELVEADPVLTELIEDEIAALRIAPLQLFKKLIVEPLKTLEEKSLLKECVVIAIDAIDEAEFHRNENGESIAWLIRSAQKETPSCVRWIMSSSTETVPFAGTEARSLWIDDIELDERVTRDMRLIVDYRIAMNPQLGWKIRERRSPPSNLAMTEFVDEIVQRARGNALYITLLMDMVEQGYIQLRNTALTLLPADLSQLYLLYFNCVFSSLQQFHTASTVMSVILASLRPLTFDRLIQIMNSGNLEYRLSPKELENRLTSLRPFVTKISSGAYAQSHNSLREWLLHGSNHTDYLINVRYGHLLHALYYTRRGNNTQEDMFELGHHLLKANPHKYMPSDLAPDMPNGRDAQVLWMQRMAGTKIQNALLYCRNVFYPNNKVTKLLLMAGAQTNAFWHETQEPLLCAYARSKNVLLVQMLIQYGVEVNCCSRNTGMTPLMHAVTAGHEEMVMCFLNAGADVSMRDSIGQTVLLHAATSGSTKIFALLYDWDWPDNGEKPQAKKEQVEKSFELAVSNGNLELCEFVIGKTDVTVDLTHNMLLACSSRKLELVQFFLSRGVTLSSDLEWQGKSSLICAVESGSWDLVLSVLSNYEGDINADIVEEHGWNSLIVACRLGHIGLIDLLLNRGIDVNYQDKAGLSALSHAVLNEHFSLAALLINRKADIYIVDNEGNTLLHFLATHHNKNLVDRLLESGIQVDAKNNLGMRAVEIALTNGKQNAVDVFLRRGARLRSLTWKIAAESNPQHVVTLIRKLFEDGKTLYRRNRFDEAMHRFHHALEKCTEFLNEENAFTPMIASVGGEKTADSTLQSIQSQLRLCKCELLYTVADIKRQNSEFGEAVQLAGEALRYADTENVMFQLHYFRAKSFFDDQKVGEARSEAQLAETLRPDNGDIRVLLTALNTSSPMNA